VATRVDQPLLENLLIEMAQTERSSTLQPRREAERLGSGATPAVAFLAVADHADRVLPEIERLAGPKNGTLGKAIGRTFSLVRDKFGDKLISKEKSYRGTLAGLHLGIDYAVLTHAVAARCGGSDVAEYLARWLDEKQPLVASCQRALTWFAAHTDTAVERAG
jgi:hypothetical protein